MKDCLKMIPSAYCWVDNRFVTVAKGLVKFFKYEAVTEWLCAIGMATCG